MPAQRRARTLLRLFPFALSLILTGCAASGERAAREEWRQALASYPRADERSGAEVPSAGPPDRSLDSGSSAVGSSAVGSSAVGSSAVGSSAVGSPRAGSPGAEFGETEGVRSLDDVLRIAEAESPTLSASFHRWTAALERVPQARSLPDPMISYAYFLRPVETVAGPQRQRFGLAQTFPLFGKLGLRGEAAVHMANAEGAVFEQMRLDLRNRITRIWNDYYFLARSIRVTEENLALLTHLENVVLRSYSAGRVTQADLLRAQLELAMAEDRLRSLRDQRSSYISSLNAEMGRRPDSPIPWPEAPSFPELGLSLESLEEALESRSPQLAALEAMAQGERAGSELARKSSFPDLTLGAEYEMMPDIPHDGQDMLIAMGSISVPIWFGRNSAERAEARARLSAAESEYVSRRDRLLAELAMLHFEFRDAGRRVELYESTLVPRARQALEVTEDAFAVGKTSFLELIEAQRSLLELGLAKERAIADRATRRADIAALTAIDVQGAEEETGDTRETRDTQEIGGSQESAFPEESPR